MVGETISFSCTIQRLATASFRPRSVLKRQLSLLPLVMMIFFCVSGGPFGLEKAISQSGAGIGLLLIVVTPLIWSLPAALMTAELTSAIPAEGGYYVWVKQGLGPFAGFLCGWWSWLYSWVDIALYPVMFASYLAAVMKQIPALAGYAPQSPIALYLCGLAVIAPFTLLNVRGIKVTGQSNVVLAVLLLAPFLTLSGIGVWKAIHDQIPVWKPLTPAGSGIGASFGSGLLIVMWNYLAWDSLSTVAEEVEQPKKVFPRALFWALPLIVLAYLLPTIAGLSSVRDPTQWTDGAWPAIARAVGGEWLGLAVGMAAIVSVLGMFNATLLAASRIPFVLAEDGYLPAFVTRVHPKWGTPWVAILVSALVAVVLSMKTFDTLLEIDVIVYSAGLLLELAALVALRKMQPDLLRPYKIPGGWPVVLLVALVPTLLIAGLVASTLKDRSSLLITLGILATGPAMYLATSASRRRAQAA